MATRPIRSGCEMMAEAIKFIRQQIGAKEARIRLLSERLERLQGQADADANQIQELKADTQELEDQLETSDRPQLNAFEEEFSASCG